MTQRISPNWPVPKAAQTMVERYGSRAQLEADHRAEEAEDARRAIFWQRVAMEIRGLRQNPMIPYSQPDLFGGESTNFFYRPLETVREEELSVIPRSSFSDSEWAELDDQEAMAVLMGEVERGATRDDFDDEDWKFLPKKVRTAVYARMAEDLERDDFDDDEWEELETGIRSAIYKKMIDNGLTRADIDDFEYDNFFDDEDLEEELYAEGTFDGDRVRAVARALQDMYNHAQTIESREHLEDEELVEMWISDHEWKVGNMEDVLRRTNRNFDLELDEIYDEINQFETDDGEDFTADEIRRAVHEALTWNDNWIIEHKECDPYHYTGDAYAASLSGSIYLDDPEYLGDGIDLSVDFADSDMDKIWEELSDEWVYDKDTVQRFLNGEKDHRGNQTVLEIELQDIGICITGNPNWDAVRRRINVELDIDLEYDENEADFTGGEPVPESEPANEDQRVYIEGEFDESGWMAYELRPENLKPEGQALRHCIGDPERGYIRRLGERQIRVISIRDPSGKPIFALTAQVVPGTNQILAVEQIKGTANRIPGTVSMSGERPHNKSKNTEEVKRVIDVLNWLGVNPYTVKDLHPTREPHSVLGHPEIQEYLHGYGIAPPRGGGRYGWESNPATWDVPAGPRLDFGFRD